MSLYPGPLFALARAWKSLRPGRRSFITFHTRHRALATTPLHILSWFFYTRISQQPAPSLRSSRRSSTCLLYPVSFLLFFPFYPGGMPLLREPVKGKGAPLPILKTFSNIHFKGENFPESPWTEPLRAGRSTNKKTEERRCFSCLLDLGKYFVSKICFASILLIPLLSKSPLKSWILFTKIFLTISMKTTMISLHLICNSPQGGPVLPDSLALCYNLINQ